MKWQFNFFQLADPNLWCFVKKLHTNMSDLLQQMTLLDTTLPINLNNGIFYNILNIAFALFCDTFYMLTSVFLKRLTVVSQSGVFVHGFT